MKRDSIEQEGQLDKVRRTLKGRAEKACVRCRAKKRTCDGGNPCQRCKDSHSACYFSDWHYTVPYPREYVEYLEEQQEQLSSGLLTMYRLLKESHIKTVPPLPEKPQAQDLLIALRGLRLEHQHAMHPAQSSTMEPQANGYIMSTVEQMSAENDARRRSRLQHRFDPGPISPTQPGTFFHAGPGPGSTSSSKQLPQSFGSMPYSAFECAPPAPNILANQPHTFPSHPATSHATSPNLGLQTGLMAQMAWPPHRGPISPGASSLDLSRAASHQQTPLPIFPDDNNFDQERARHWSWNGVENNGFGVGYLVSPHDLETIEQRGEIVEAPDSVVRS